MNVVLQEPWTVESFLAWEDTQEGKYEFDGLHVIPMTGGSRAHQKIMTNLIRALEDLLDPEGFDAVAEMRLNIANKIRYPDVTICVGRIANEIRTLRDAIATFEILSPDTAAIDINDKLIDYALLPSLRYYVLIEQTRKFVSVWHREAETWGEITLADGSIALPEIGVALPLDAVYRGLGL